MDYLRDLELHTIVGVAVVAIILLYPVYAKIQDKRNLALYTGMLDLDPAALPRKGGKIQGTALIAGGSYAGLITARIFSTHFAKVIVVESETLSSPDQPRKNVQQYNQIHTILQYTHGVLSRLFPRLDEFVLAANGRTTTEITNYYAKGKYVKMDPSMITTPWLCMTRPGFEPMMRKMVMATVNNVEFINGTVTGIKVSDDRQTITGATIRRKDSEKGDETIDVKIVSDCTGPSTAALKWLRNLDFNVPNKRSYCPNVKYWTICLPTSEKIREEIVFPNGKRWHGKEVWLYALAPDPGNGRDFSIGLQRTEKEELMVAILAWGKECPVPGPEATVEDLVEFVANSAPQYEWFREFGNKILDHIRSSNIEMPKGSRLLFQQCYKLDYANTAGLPNNLVCVGDSRCRVNPTYGQGIAKASIGAIALDATLRKHSHGQTLDADFNHQYFLREGARVNGFYEFTKREDYGYPGTEVEEGEDASLGKFDRWYMDWLVKACHTDAKLGSTLWRCINATRPGTDLKSYSVMFKVFRTALLG